MDANLQEVLDTTHDCNSDIRSLVEMCNKKISGLQATDGGNVELKLHNYLKKHAQRIARIIDEMDIKMKASMQEMTTKYEMYSQSMIQQKREIQGAFSTFQSK